MTIKAQPIEEDQAELLKDITSLLEKSEIPYMITGAWSVVYYGRPRASHDIDFVVEVKTERVSGILRLFKQLSGDFFVQTSEIKKAIKKKGHFNIFHLPTALKLDFWLLTSNPFDMSRFSRRKKARILGQSMWIASIEDTILQKLRWYKKATIEKHLVDAAFVYQIQKKNLDGRYLKAWVKKLEVEDDYKKLGKIDLEDYL